MVIADTSFWIALIIEKDTYNRQAREALMKLDQPLITTWPVIAETCHILLKRIDNNAQTKFVEGITEKKYQIFEIKENQAPHIVELMEQYADLPMDLADASLVLLAEHLGHGKILSADQRDFNTYRWNNREPFENLMFPVA
ncbi:MAG: type II toxin-antitoxin system VapC family toxin [Phormidesmis sp.]